jgi:hypothetical protein
LVDSHFKRRPNELARKKRKMRRGEEEGGKGMEEESGGKKEGGQGALSLRACLVSFKRCFKSAMFIYTKMKI